MFEHMVERCSKALFVSTVSLVLLFCRFVPVTACRHTSNKTQTATKNVIKHITRLHVVRQRVALSDKTMRRQTDFQHQVIKGALSIFV